MLLILELPACAATLSIGGQLIKWSPRRTPFCRDAFLLAIIISALAVMIPGAAPSEIQALSPAAPGEVDPPMRSVLGEMVGDGRQPKWSLMVERAERLRARRDYAQAADTYAWYPLAAHRSAARPPAYRAIKKPRAEPRPDFIVSSRDATPWKSVRPPRLPIAWITAGLAVAACPVFLGIISPARVSPSARFVSPIAPAFEAIDIYGASELLV